MVGKRQVRKVERGRGNWGTPSAYSTQSELKGKVYLADSLGEHKGGWRYFEKGEDKLKK